MLPRKSPFTTCCIPTPTLDAGPAASSLEDLELPVLHDLDGGLVLAVARRREREGAERRVEVLHLGEARLDVLAARLAAGLLDGLRQDQHAGIGLGGELIGGEAARGHRLLE